MASTREQVLAAVRDLVAQALPNADVKRNQATAPRIRPGGNVNILDGDPGEAEIDLSPLAYNYVHRIPLEVTAYETAGRTREQVVDDMLSAVGAGIVANRTLSGLCQWLDAEAPTGEDLKTQGAAPARLADAVIVAIYATASPLT